MNAIATILSGPLAQAIGWALLHLLWQGVLVAAILAASLALLQRQSANARYLASCGALLILVALSLVTAVRAYDPIRTSSYEPSFAAPAVNSEMASASAAATDPIRSPRLAILSAWAGSHLPQIVFAWLVGVTLLSARLIFGWVGAHRLAARHARPAEPRWELAMERIADALQLRRTIRLLESAAVDVPTVIGWLRPVVLLPVATISGLSTEQIEMILAHELAHIRRHDFIVNLLQSTVETLFFYQPAVWWISRRIRVEREHCCDDLAVVVSGDPIRYARALTRFEELRIDAAQAVVAASGGSLIGRIRRLVVAHGESASWSSRWAAGAALLTVIASILVAPALPIFANNEQQPPAPPAAESPSPSHPIADSQIEVEGSPDETDVVDAYDIDNLDDRREPPVPPRVPTTPRVEVGPIVVDVPAIVAEVTRALAEVPLPPMVEIAMPGQAKRKIADERNLTIDDLIALRTSGVTPKYIEEMRALGLGNLSLNDVIELRMHGVTPDYIRAMRAAGIEMRSAEAAVGLRMHGVTPRYMKQMADAGYKNLSSRDLAELRMHGVSADLVKSLAETGYARLSVKDLVRLAASGVNAQFIRDLAKYRSKQ